MRETIKRIETDAAFRQFLGIPFTKPAPHYSTFSQNYIRRFQGTDVFEQIFINIVNQAIEKKLVGGSEFFTDSTHIKANANKKKFKTEVTRKIKERKLDLEKEINEERKKQEKSLLNTGLQSSKQTQKCENQLKRLSEICFMLRSRCKTNF